MKFGSVPVRKRALLFLFLGLLSLCALAVIFGFLPPSSFPPGVIIAHSPAITGRFIGSPSLAILPNGEYLAAHDFFGPGSGEHSKGTTRVYASRDGGKTWRFRSEIRGAFWSVLFVHRNALYLLGVDRNGGSGIFDTAAKWLSLSRRTKAAGNHIVIRRSLDGGRTWTVPQDDRSGLLMAGRYGFAPTPVITHDGFIWRAQGTGMMYAPENSDLLKAESWTLIPGPKTRAKNLLDGDMQGWGEGNAVVSPDDKIVNLAMVRYLEPGNDHAALISYDLSKKAAVFDGKKDFVKMPGARVKFTVRFDPFSKRYWALTNYLSPDDYGDKPALRRNTVALVSSPNLRDWKLESIVLHHPDTAHHGFQYLDWDFEGNDIIALCRTAWPDGRGGPPRQHDANFLTFHRFKDFRTMAPN